MQVLAVRHPEHDRDGDEGFARVQGRAPRQPFGIWIWIPDGCRIVRPLRAAWAPVYLGSWLLPKFAIVEGARSFGSGRRAVCWGFLVRRATQLIRVAARISGSSLEETADGSRNREVV